MTINTNPCFIQMVHLMTLTSITRDRATCTTRRTLSVTTTSPASLMPISSKTIRTTAQTIHITNHAVLRITTLEVEGASLLHSHSHLQRTLTMPTTTSGTVPPLCTMLLGDHHHLMKCVILVHDLHIGLLTQFLAQHFTHTPEGPLVHHLFLGSTAPIQG